VAAFVLLRFLKELDVPENGGERVAYFMSNAGGQFAERGEFSRFDDLILIASYFGVALLERFRHEVEGIGERAEFVVARIRDAVGEIAFLNPFCSGHEFVHRTGNSARHADADESGNSESDAGYDCDCEEAAPLHVADKCFSGKEREGARLFFAARYRQCVGEIIHGEFFRAAPVPRCLFLPVAAITNFAVFDREIGVGKARARR